MESQQKSKRKERDSQVEVEQLIKGQQDLVKSLETFQNSHQKELSEIKQSHEKEMSRMREVVRFHNLDESPSQRTQIERRDVDDSEDSPKLRIKKDFNQSKLDLTLDIAAIEQSQNDRANPSTKHQEDGQYAFFNTAKNQHIRSGSAAGQAGF